MRNRKKEERGQALIIFVLALVVLLTFAALTIDGGLAYVARRDTQNAADASALAAADSLLEGSTTAAAITAALDIAAANGYDNADPDVSVAINIPPQSGSYVGDPEYIEVIIERPANTYFARVVGKDHWDIHARAVASYAPESRPYSIIALNPTACRSMEFNGQVSVIITNAGTLTNSECFPDAFYAEGGVYVVDEANDVVGGWLQSGTSGTISPTPSRVGHYPDPLADVEEPTLITEPVQTCPTYSGAAGTKTLQPGYYNCKIDPPGNWGLRFEPGDYHITGGLVIDGSGSVTFGSGLYALGGVGLTITGSASVTGDGVTFYVYEGQTVLTGTGKTNLDAPTDGPYEGIVIFQKRTLTATVDLSGNAITDGWGTVYAAGAEIHVRGNGTTSYQFIGDTFLTDGTTDLNIDFFAGFLAEVPFARLVE